MSNESKIEWTDATWNPVRGCTKISPGCKNCYAETFAERWRGVAGHPYEQGFDLRLVPNKLEEPLRWKKPRRIFVNSMSDLFHEGVPFEYIDKVFVIIKLTTHHTYQILTKRSARMCEYIKSRHGNGVQFESAAREMGLWERYASVGEVRWPIHNAILGVSTENQEYADKRIPEAIVPLLDMGWKTMISAEPLLGPIRFSLVPGFNRVNTPLHRLWVIVGGESGPGARPFNIRWAEDIISQCEIARVACFVKQLGARPMDQCVEDSAMDHNGVRMKLLSRKGSDPSEWPEFLRVREFPL